MILSLFEVGIFDDGDTYLIILGVETPNSVRSLFGIGKVNGDFRIELFWLNPFIR